VVNQKGEVVQSGILETLVAVRNPKPLRRNSTVLDTPQRPKMLSQPEPLTHSVAPQELASKETA